MRKSRQFRPSGWDPLEERALLSTKGVYLGPPPGVPVARTDAFAEARLAANLQVAAQGYGGASIVFLGDSITDYWTSHGASSWNSMIAPLGAVDFGIYGNTTGNLLSQIEAGELAGKPKVVVLMIGTNDIVKGANASQVAQGIAANVAAIRTLSPQTQIVLMGLLPILGGTNTPRTTTAMWVNASIANLEDGVHVHFVNLSSLYLLPGGTQNSLFFLDGVHPSASGYNLWGSQLRGVLDSLTGQSTSTSGQQGTPTPSLPLTPPPAAPPVLIRWHPHRIRTRHRPL